MPNTFTAFGCRHFGDRIEAKRLTEDIRFRPRCTFGDHEYVRAGITTLSAALAAAVSRFILCLIDLELTAIHFLAVQVLNRPRGVLA